MQVEPGELVSYFGTVGIKVEELRANPKLHIAAFSSALLAAGGCWVLLLAKRSFS